MIVAALMLAAGCGGSDPPAAADETIRPTKVVGCATLRQSTEPGFRLTGTNLTRTDEGLDVIWRTNRRMPDTGTVLYSVLASDESENISRQVGVKYQDSSQIAFFVFDFEEATQTNLDGEATATGNTVEAHFPNVEIEPLGEPFRWRSVLNVDGDDIDFCPAVGDDQFNPATLSYP